ncbi:MAG: response regulator [Tannerellaceae bacterium]|nr:response regulator [Tannerellaceae bacterium]
MNNENCEYDYRLINFSDEWIKNGNNPNVVFTKLPPGKYTLQVRATNGDRIRGSDIYSLRIVVAHPWWLSTTAFIIYSMLFVLLAYIIYLVIRNRIRLNRQLLLEHIEKQNQQKIHESKLNFFTNVAHEFFTPLTLIYGPAQHLLEKIDLDDYTKHYIQIIKNNSDRMQKLINELMEFRKVESGHTPLHPESIDIPLLMAYIADNYSDIAHENKIEFIIEKENISSLVTDRNSLEKIVFNLISNAFKYTPAGGYIHVRVWQEEELYLTVRNSGKGLTEKQMDKIFNRFRIFDSSRLEGSRSTGIGLGLAKSLAELLGGNIEVNSSLGEYVEFRVHIPPMEAKPENYREPEMADTLSTLSGDEPVHRNISILIVEDKRNIRELLKDILAPWYHITEAGNGVEALESIEVNRPDIIISDILMPHLDGIGLIDKLKADPKTAHIPVIHISAKSSVEDQISGYQHGAALYITKPFHPRHVLATVENLINRHSTLKEYFNSSRSSIVVKDGLSIHQDDERLLQEIISFIEKNIDDESLNPNSIAEALGLSKATLYRKPKDITGKTPSEYVRSIRLEYVARLLITTRLSVTEIMFKSGFTNKSYFYREFAKQYGTSPKEYRITQTGK